MTLRSVVVGAGAFLLLVALAPDVQAETPTPTPTPGVTAVASPSAEPRGGATGPTTAVPDQASDPTDSATPTPTPTPTSGLSLTVSPTGGPVAGAFYEDLGRFAFAGSVAGVPDGTVVTVSQQIRTGVWAAVATGTLTAGSYDVSAPVRAAGATSFRASYPVGDGGLVASPVSTVVVRDAVVVLNRPPAVDSLKTVVLSGVVVPARAGVVIGIDVQRGSSWLPIATAVTDAAGRFARTTGYDRGGLTSYAIRARYHAVNRDRTETSASQVLTRLAVLDPEVDATTGADVAKTYRKGCPVGPSKLRTVHLNYYGRDKRMHRGVIIVRTDLTQEIVRAFGTALSHRYPIAKMNNPNVYGGNDPRQMAADNTSGFNCRKVVGNPYAQSPHSYGIAIDVNTVQNPYRDVHGKWWPSNGKSYIKRTPSRWGMLSKSSPLTKSLRHDHFFWGGLWKPDRDYQHFEYRG